jgi:hypothetical protein
MNRVGRRTEIAHKILLVVALVTLMGAGTLAGQSSATVDSMQRRVTLGIVAMAPACDSCASESSASWQQSNRHDDCIYERLFGTATNSTIHVQTRQLASLPVKE